MALLAALSEADAAQLDALCAACADYYEEVTGLPPGPAEAQSLFLAIPPHGDYDKKRLWGLFRDDRLVGVVDGAFDHPEAGSFWIGLVMLEPSVRGQGLGTAVLAEVAEHARGGGASRLSLAVKSDYEAARRFWQRHGFQSVGDRILEMPGLGSTRFQLMQKSA